MASVLEQVLAQVTPEVSRQISRRLGVDQQTVQLLITIAVPILVAALARNSATPQGASSLSNALAHDHDGTILEDVPSAVRNYQDQPGDGILKHVLGDQRSEVGDVLTQVTGADGSAILQMLAPIVMGVLGNMQRQQNLDPGSLATTLGQEREQLAQSEISPSQASSGRPGDATESSDPLMDLLAQFLR
jgi:hypothetical protein